MMGERADRSPILTPDKTEVFGKPASVLIRNLSARQSTRAINNINLDIRPGEILGLAGVSGNGQHLLADALVGLTPFMPVKSLSTAWQYRRLHGRHAALRRCPTSRSSRRLTPWRPICH